MKKIKVRQLAGHTPLYATNHAAGADLTALIAADITLKPLAKAIISTGLILAIPNGYEGQVRSRSGLSSKYGIMVINGVGTIDSDYRGEIKVPLINLSNEDYTIKNGDRIAQLVISPVVQAKFIKVSKLKATRRGAGGFGSSGY
ncbi:MAG: dUTP diphosphatase [Spirochaetaceae bacterium]|nr:dUTP diphosphatase [Spirochaetaceae bacterium]